MEKVSKEQAMKDWFARQMGKTELKEEEIETKQETNRKEFVENNKVRDIKNLYVKLAAEKMGGVLTLAKVAGISQPHLTNIIYGKKDLTPELKEKIDKALKNRHRYLPKG